MAGIAGFKEGSKAIVIAGKMGCYQIRSSLHASMRIIDTLHSTDCHGESGKSLLKSFLLFYPLI